MKEHINVFLYMFYFPSSIVLFAHQVNRIMPMCITRGKSIRLYLACDMMVYCKVLGLSGPAARHPCCFCTLSKTEMQESVANREPGTLRSLNQINDHHAIFQANGSDLTKAKDISWNVIGLPLLNIPIDQVLPCIAILIDILKLFHLTMLCVVYNTLQL